jgi:hypothetical protein
LGRASSITVPIGMLAVISLTLMHRQDFIRLHKAQVGTCNPRPSGSQQKSLLFDGRCTESHRWSQFVPERASAKSLGDATADLTCTPLNRCRILDTRKSEYLQMCGNALTQSVASSGVWRPAGICGTTTFGTFDVTQPIRPLVSGNVRLLSEKVCPEPRARRKVCLRAWFEAGQAEAIGERGTHGCSSRLRAHRRDGRAVQGGVCVRHWGGVVECWAA